jgi:signal transduction histidine kinase
VIFLSARTGAEDITRAFEVGGSDYLTKPINTRELISRVDKVLGLHRQAVQLGTTAAGTEQLLRSRDEALQACRAAQEMNQKRGDIMAMMSHELRTPLNGILGAAAILAKLEIGPEVRSLVGVIQQSGEGLLSLLNNLLDLSDIQQGAITLESQSLDIAKIVEGLFSFLLPAAESKGLSLRVTVDSHAPPQAVGDPGRIRQILLNLLDNALKFTAQGEVTLKYDWRESQAGKILLRFEVKDTGIGIPLARGNEIFKPYIQGDGSTTRRHGGAGLGLGMVRGLCQLMGGDVTYSSQPGVGSTFSAWIEVKKSQPQPAVQAGGDKLRELRVLVAEDNLINQMLISRILRLWGIKARVCSDGRGALATALNEPFDLILMDLHMPFMDGREVATEIRRQPGRQPFICAITADDSSSAREDCLAVGMEAFISKPYTPERLLEICRQVAAERL